MMDGLDKAKAAEDGECICPESCEQGKSACKGDCGCQKCRSDYLDWLSDKGR